MYQVTFFLLVYIWIAVALVIFPFAMRITAPYGRHTTGQWGVLINNRLGWIIMESPALLVFTGCFLFGSAKHTFVSWIFFGLWVLHYINRTVIFPFRLRTKGKKMPLAILFMALGFNSVNGFINGYYLGSLASYPISWVTDPRFIIGIIMFLWGMAINWQSDNILIHLREPGQTGYIIPTQGLFKYISCPNHFGEIIEWFGFAVMTWCTPALAFAIWTLVNLLPRALDHHRWYKSTFPDYPPKLKALFPFIL
ncbi:MAG: 3-oxo-5-alpha-steroid 4-dehydrogenase [Bacteroidota bacterium]